MLNKLIINLPPKINIILWKNKKYNNCINFYVYNNNKKLILSSKVNKKSNNLKLDINTNSIIIDRNFINHNNNKISKFLFKFLKSWDLYFFNKIKFKGKGFRMRFLKKNKFVKFFFGRSHKTFIWFKKIMMKKINKYKFVLKGLNKNNVIWNSNLVTKIKPLNMYTLRGLRKTRQTIFKRKGKKGTYI